MKATAQVQHYLNSAWYYKKKAEKLDDEIRILRSKAEKMTTSYQEAPVFASGIEDQRQAKIDEMADKQREYKKMLQQCRNQLQEIQYVINMLEDFQERIVLEFRYMHFMHWQDIAFRLYYTERQILNIHGEALMHLLECDKKIMERNGGKSFFAKKEKSLLDFLKTFQ